MTNKLLKDHKILFLGFSMQKYYSAALFFKLFLAKETLVCSTSLLHNFEIDKKRQLRRGFVPSFLS